ncbi:MAG: gamma-glutamylcyclotransferase family protein, partial [Myxococcota bacterium]
MHDGDDVNGSVAAGDLFAFYGLLKKGARGMPTHIDLASSGTFLGSCWFRGTMYALDGYPGVVDGDTLCCGVRYRVEAPNIIGDLDDFEDVLPHDIERSLYLRKRTTVLTKKGRPTGETAWVYWYNQSIEGRRLIPSGDWPLSAGRPLTDKYGDR